LELDFTRTRIESKEEDPKEHLLVKIETLE